MNFRRKIFLVVFMMGFIPALAILLVAAALLNSTIDRVGAVGLEKSVQSASSMTADSEKALGIFLAEALNRDIDWDDDSRLEKWLNENHLDLAFRAENGKLTDFKAIFISSENANNLPTIRFSPGVFHIEIEEKSYICFALGDSNSAVGCGVMMPSGYAERGQSLSNALSAAASLDIYKKFSLKLLAVITAVMVGLVIIIGLIVSTIISRRLVKPLEILSDGARVIGEGNLDYQVTIPGLDEFSRLADSFNAMALSIKDNQAKLLAAERLAAWRDVARRIAHEIRNPLTPITVELYRLRQKITDSGSALADDTIGSLDSIDSQIRALQDLSGQFSLFAKEPDLKKIRCDIREVLNKAVGLYRNYEHVDFKIDIADNIPSLDIDPGMIGRLFNNLLKNSIEASPNGVAIRIKLDKSKNTVNIVVRDNGPGFPSEKLEKIDQPYITTKGGGTGLGMAISKKIVEEHSGTIRFYNDNGAVAEITLPI